MDRNVQPSQAEFRIKLENKSLCVYSPTAELAVPGDPFATFTEVDWFGWTNLKRPGSGEYTEFQAKGRYGKSSAVLDVRMLKPEHTLGMCRATTTGAP